VIETMGNIGPDAKSAIPIIANAFEPAMLSLEASAKKRNAPIMHVLRDRNIPANVIVALGRIDPMIKSQLPSLLELGIPDELSSGYLPGNSRNRSQAEYEASWRKAGEMVKKLGTRK
jgi:hypothetical protein